MFAEAQDMLLSDGCDQTTGTIVHRPGVERTSSSGDARAQIDEDPIIETNRVMEPDRVIEAGAPPLLVDECPLDSGSDVRHIGEHARMKQALLRQ